MAGEVERPCFGTGDGIDGVGIEFAPTGNDEAGAFGRADPEAWPCAFPFRLTSSEVSPDTADEDGAANDTSPKSSTSGCAVLGGPREPVLAARAAELVELLEVLATSELSE